MNATMVSSSFFVTAMAALSIPAAAQESYSYPYGHLNYVEGTVTVQRASKPEPEAGAVNVPILPGDRLWTEGGSRAEVVFADGTVLRLGELTKLDLEELDKELLVRLWSGSLIVKLEEPRASVRVDAPAASVYPSAPGTYRLDVEAEHLSLSVSSGSAELASSVGSVLIGAGEQSEITRGLSPSTPQAFNTARLDELGEWSESRDRRVSRTQDVIVRSLPHEVHHYADDLEEHGSWQYENDYGYVWYPQVGASWAPYRDGWWHYTGLGYTWIAYEPWGWAPYHYGRWGHGHRGWYWIPGSYWSPAWVSFAFGPAWIGWSPLGFHNRAVFGFDSVFHHGRHFRGGKRFAHGFDDCAGWSFVEKGHFGRRAGRDQLGADVVAPSAHRARVFDSGAVLRRDLTPMASGSVRRGAIEARTVSRQGVARRLTSRVESSPRLSLTDRSALRSGGARERTVWQNGDLTRPTTDGRDRRAQTGTAESSRGRSSVSNGVLSRGNTLRSSRPRGFESGMDASPRERGRAGTTFSSPRGSESARPSRLRSDSSRRNGSSTSQPSRSSVGERTRERFGRAPSSSARPARPSSGRPMVGAPRSSGTRGQGATATSSSGRGRSSGVQRGGARGSSRGPSGTRGNRSN
ncbi:MAG TPA: FecR family protein [Vicinamibacteria bacterium]|nr:FecR family protein [Vicinamibacteria bacterium]